MAAKQLESINALNKNIKKNLAVLEEKLKSTEKFVQSTQQTVEHYKKLVDSYKVIYSELKYLKSPPKIDNEVSVNIQELDQDFKKVYSIYIDIHNTYTYYRELADKFDQCGKKRKCEIEDGPPKTKRKTDSRKKVLDLFEGGRKWTISEISHKYPDIGYSTIHGILNSTDTLGRELSGKIHYYYLK